MGGCADHDYLFYYFAFMTILKICFALFWNVRTRKSIKSINEEDGTLTMIDYKISDLNIRDRNHKIQRDFLVVFPEVERDSFLPSLNCIQKVIPFLEQRAWKNAMCRILKPIFGKKLSPNLIRHVWLSNDRSDVDISKPKPLIPVNKRKPDLEPEQDFLVISLSEKDREYVFKGVTKKEYSVNNTIGHEIHFSVRKQSKKDVPKTKHKDSQTDQADLQTGQSI